MSRDEFDFIKHIKKSFGLQSVGDDCAVLPLGGPADLVITADLLVEGIDFCMDWVDPESFGHKALAVSLSDIAAMGAIPNWAMLSIAVPTDVWESEFLSSFYTGWHMLAAGFGVELIGGDISRSDSKFVVDSIAGGSIESGTAVLRSGAGVGDAIFVTGQLGGAAAGLDLLKRGDTTNEVEPWKRSLIDHQLKPTPRLTEGQFLRESRIATSMIDLSDGLSSDLFHICEASGVGALIDAALIPVNPALGNLYDANKALSTAINGGEDFELLFTASEERATELENETFFRIGTITANNGMVELKDGDRMIKLKPSGYRHF